MKKAVKGSDRNKNKRLQGDQNKNNQKHKCGYKYNQNEEIKRNKRENQHCHQEFIPMRVQKVISLGWH